MKISTMRKIDRMIGFPICIILTIIRKISDLKQILFKPNPKKIERILFIKLAEQGSTVLSYPAMQQAAKMVDSDKVFFLVFEENRFIIDVLEIIPRQNVFPIPTKNFYRFLIGLLHIMVRIRRLNIDAAIDFEFFARSSAILTYICGAKFRVGMHPYYKEAMYRGDLMTHRINYNPHLHISQTYMAMLETLNLPKKDLPAINLDLPPIQRVSPKFKPSIKELEHFRSIIELVAEKKKFSPLILLNPNASDLVPLRCWPKEYYIQLAGKLLKKFPNVHIAFTGAPNEVKISNDLVREVNNKRCFSMAGKTTLRELLLLYCLSDVLITNDSGPALFAVLTPIRTITLFGPETPKLFGLFSNKNNIIWKGIPCSPCINAYNNRQSRCTDNICMQRITPDEVFEKFCSIFKL